MDGKLEGSINWLLTRCNKKKLVSFINIKCSLVHLLTAVKQIFAW